MKVFLSKLFIAMIIAFMATNLSAQQRFILLPFDNTNGDISLNGPMYEVQDSLMKALNALDPDHEHFYIIPQDSLYELLAEKNLDPTNPQYKTDMWNVAKQLNAKYVITGDFDKVQGKFLINCYVVKTKTKIRKKKYQARNIFKTEDKLLEAIPIIVEAIGPFLMK